MGDIRTCCHCGNSFVNDDDEAEYDVCDDCRCEFTRQHHLWLIRSCRVHAENKGKAPHLIPVTRHTP